MADYIWSDPHLGHTNIIRYCNRPFLDREGHPDTEAMNKALLRAWRETVKGNDTIITLGDVCFKWEKEKLANTIQNLPGHKILILGNHDGEKDPKNRHNKLKFWYDVGFDEVYPWPIIYNEWYILSHEPVFLNAAIPYMNVHGHWHDKSFVEPYYVNVCVEQTNYKPILLSSVLPVTEEMSKFEHVAPPGAIHLHDGEVHHR